MGSKDDYVGREHWGLDLTQGWEMLASLVRNDVSKRVVGWGACVLWGSLDKFKALMQTLACNDVFKYRPEGLKYMHKPKTLNLSPQHVPVCFSESKPAQWGGFGETGRAELESFVGTQLPLSESVEATVSN